MDIQNIKVDHRNKLFYFFKRVMSIDTIVLKVGYMSNFILNAPICISIEHAIYIYF